jgi:hypothetical protein
VWLVARHVEKIRLIYRGKKEWEWQCEWTSSRSVFCIISYKSGNHDLTYFLNVLKAAGACFPVWDIMATMLPVCHVLRNVKGLRTLVSAAKLALGNTNCTEPSPKGDYLHGSAICEPVAAHEVIYCVKYLKSS